MAITTAIFIVITQLKNTDVRYHGVNNTQMFQKKKIVNRRIFFSVEIR